MFAASGGVADCRVLVWGFQGMLGGGGGFRTVEGFGVCLTMPSVLASFLVPVTGAHGS